MCDSGVALAPMMLGGPQEAAMRAGTPESAWRGGVSAWRPRPRERIWRKSRRASRSLAARLLKLLVAAIPDLRLNSSAVHKIANTLNLTFPGVLGESMLIALDLEGVEVSMGSACAAGAVEPSHVLLAMGLSRRRGAQLAAT